jgi:hypothetical protein
MLNMPTEEKKSQAKREFHCACATGDLSAIAPMVAPADESTAEPDRSEPSKAPAAVAAAADEHKTRG